MIRLSTPSITAPNLMIENNDISFGETIKMSLKIICFIEPVDCLLHRVHNQLFLPYPLIFLYIG